MDYDALVKAGEIISTAIVNQDTTELAELLVPGQCELAYVIEAPAVGGSTIGVAAIPPPAAHSSNQGPNSARGAASSTVGGGGGGGGSSAAALTAAAGGGGLAAAISQRGELHGVTEIALSYKALFAWLQAGKHIVEPAVHPEPRRGVRKGRADESVRALDAKQLSSKLTVTWGRPWFLLREDMYFTDDGRIFAIERQLLKPDDPTRPEYLEDRAAFFGDGRPRISALNAAPPVLDFSFCNLSEPMDMMRVAPVSGKRHRAAPIYVPETKNSEAVGLYNPNAQGQGPAGIHVVKARNRKGEEGAYILDSQTLDTARAKMKKADEEGQREQDVLRGLAAKLLFKFDADAVRVCNNSLLSASQLVRVCRSLVANYALTITWVDLSCNSLTSLPLDLGVLPITTLYAHSNKLADWSNIIAAITPLKRLSVLTLFGNPVANTNANYKAEALSRISHIPDRAVPLKSLDFVAVSRCDSVVAEMHFQKRHPSPRNSRNLTPRSRNF